MHYGSAIQFLELTSQTKCSFETCSTVTIASPIRCFTSFLFLPDRNSDVDAIRKNLCMFFFSLLDLTRGILSYDRTANRTRTRAKRNTAVSKIPIPPLLTLIPDSKTLPQPPPPRSPIRPVKELSQPPPPPPQ